MRWRIFEAKALHLHSLARLRERARGEGGETNTKDVSSNNIPVYASLASPASGRGVVIEDIEPKMKDPFLRTASILRGARYKENMTQVDLAKKLKFTQSDLSKMEHGKRPIGKKLAQRIAEILKIDYRILL
jgi:ribosome-binding protein aMBF1 (putative translation factor)